MLFSDEPEVFLPKYSQPGIFHVAHFRRIVNLVIMTLSYCEKETNLRKCGIIVQSDPLRGPHYVEMEIINLIP